VSEPDLTLLPDGWEPVVPFEDSFDAQYGLRIVAADADEGIVEARVRIRPDLLGLHGSVGSGLYATIAETLASRGTANVMLPQGRMALGLSNDTSLIATVSAGTIHAIARASSRGEDAWVWTVEARDDDGRLCALSRVTVAVRELD
jgi:1,4-dihydroxy-2-naphthoyl-CoA hydrolase